MSVSPVGQLNRTETTSSTVRPPSERWILNSWLDQLLIVSTPLLIIPIVFFIDSPWVGVQAETISLVVTSFFALGHHLPGLIRAYGDRELFQRFQWRFILAPPLIFAAVIPLYSYHYGLFRLIIIIWATWHGLMQLYGFSRIYDAKAGSTSRITAYWDWLLCLCWFSTGTVFSYGGQSDLLEHLYSIGVPLIPPIAIRSFKWICLTISLIVLVGFAANYLLQCHRGSRPSSIKLALLVSGIGFFWFAVVIIENAVLGIALFDISHDVQYLAIVWLFNCRRVSSRPDLGRFMKFVFRRGMSLLYVGLVVAYGAIGLIPSLVQDETVKTLFTGILATSTLLHYYYDGFIWKVRESSTRVGLGLRETSRVPRLDRGHSFHLLKWSPLILLVGWFLMTDLGDSSLSAAAKKRLKHRYTEQLASSNRLPVDVEERSWLFTEYQRVQNIAAAAPHDRQAQLRAVTMQANLGRPDEAIEMLEKLLRQNPGFFDGYVTLGGIQLFRGELERASTSFLNALLYASTRNQRVNANLKLGLVYLRQKEFELAQAKFAEALKEDPRVKASIDSFYQLQKASDTPESL